MDISKAFNSEQVYKELRARGEEPISLLERVQECGFETLESYFLAKTDYQLGRTIFSYKEVKPENAATEMLNMISVGQAGLLLMNTDKTVVYHGDEYYNSEYCEANDISVIDYYSSGGTLVASNGELSIGITIPNTIDTSLSWFLNKLSKIVSVYEDGITIDNNDLLINGKKFCGSTSYTTEDSFSAIAQISFDDKSELIRNICGINPNKEPGFISNVTRYEIREAIKRWLL